MYKSQFWKIDTYDWFCGPGSHLLNSDTSVKVYEEYIDWEPLFIFENCK